MSRFNGAKLRRLRQLRGLSLSDVHERTGISRAQISKIENGKADPRMSTVTELLTCYGASLSDVEATTPRVMTIREVRQRSNRAAEILERSGLGESDPQLRLDQKSAREEVAAERRALATRS